MTQEQKAERYDNLVAEADVVNRELSKLKSQNAGVNTKSDEYNKKVQHLNNKLSFLEAELEKLYL
jgi:predicted nuclease with TOPRIM domain